jgi:hypothetical protein
LRAQLWLAAFFSWSCGDPVREQRVASLGAEAPGVPPGPLHRPGQPCGVCHGDGGDAKPSFSVSGTVYASPDGDAPLPRVRVRLLDARGVSHVTETNCAGNFFLTPTELAPTYPLWVTLERGEDVVEMRSAISREASCAGCHARPASPRSPGAVYFFERAKATAEGTSCE